MTYLTQEVGALRTRIVHARRRLSIVRTAPRYEGVWLCAREVEPSIQLVKLRIAGVQSVETCCQSSGDELSVVVLPASPSERANCVQYVVTGCREIKLVASGGGFSRTTAAAVTF